LSVQLTLMYKESDEELVDATLYKQIVEPLRYLCHARHHAWYYIWTYGVGLIGRFMDNHMTSQLIAAKRILKYVKGTEGVRILYGTNQDNS
jgi:hypothetical protein